MEANAALRLTSCGGTRRGLPGDAGALGPGERHRDTHGRGLARLDRKRKGKKLSNQDWVSKSDPEAKIAKLKDLARPIWPTSPSTRWIWTPARWWPPSYTRPTRVDTTTLEKTLAAAKENLEAVDAAPTAEDPFGRMCDRQGLSLTVGLKGARRRPLEDADLRAQAERFCALAGDGAARRAVTNNRTRLLSGVAKEAFKLRAEIVERSFAHNLDRGGMRRTWLRGRENVHKRYLLHVAGHNLSLLMRTLLIGAGTPREAVAGGYGCICVLIAPAGAVLVAQMVLIVSEDGETAFVALCFAVE